MIHNFFDTAGRGMAVLLAYLFFPLSHKEVLSRVFTKDGK